MSNRADELCIQLTLRIMVLDGGMGTMIQSYGLEEADFRGTRFADWPSDLKGNNDLLVPSKPEMVTAIHDAYLAAGTDILETNTFNATTIAMADYQMESLVSEINFAAARLARECADAWSARTPESASPNVITATTLMPVCPMRLASMISAPRRWRGIPASGPAPVSSISSAAAAAPRRRILPPWHGQWRGGTAPLADDPRCLPAGGAGYARHGPAGNNSGNSRNGKTSRSVRSQNGEIGLNIPRDRNSTFEPTLTGKNEKQLDGFDDRIISLYFRGLSTRDIQTHFKDVYGVDVSAGFISQVTHAVMDEVKRWQQWPLDALYPIV